MEQQNEAPYYFPLGATRTNSGPLRDCLISLGVTETSLIALERNRIHAEIPHIRLGGKRYTRRDWVAEWLESLKTTAP